MDRFLLFLCIAISFLSLAHCGTFYKRREEFSRIQRYELIHFDEAALEQHNVLSFDAFGRHYEVELVRNDALNPSQIRHANVDPAQHLRDQPFTSLTASCHFNGHVSQAQTSLVSITMCRQHGVQGHIQAFNDTLWVYPSAYYLDDTQSTYGTRDEHLVWRQSDLYRDPDAPAWHRGGVRVASHDLHPQQSHTLDDEDVEVGRSLLQQSAYNDGANEVELFLMVGPVRYNRYVEEAERSGVDWYETLVHDIYTLVADVSTRYANAQWGAHVGAVHFNFVELEVVFEFSGRYASMKPQWYYSNCADLSTCNVNGDSLLANLRQWILAYKDQASYDTAHFLMDILPEPQNLGKAYVASVCTTNGYGIGYSADISNDYIEFVKTVAHELGHNFNMSHDGMDNACDGDLYIMGYGEGTGAFSPCSVAELQGFFSDREGLECLGSSVQPLRSNADSSGRKLTPSPTARPTVHCYEIDGLQFGAGGNNWNGQWFDDGVADGYPYYYSTASSSSGGYYLSYGKNEGAWCVTRTIGSCRSNYGYCSKTTDELLKCTEWELGSSVANAVVIQDCDGPITTTTTTTTTTTSTTTTTIVTLPPAPTAPTATTTLQPTISPTLSPSANPTVQTTSTSTSTSDDDTACVSISNLPATADGTDYSVEWAAQGTRNGYAYYTNAGLRGTYLCNSNAVWCITSTLCQCDLRYLIAQCTNPTDELLACDNFWLRSSGSGRSGTYYDGVSVADCSSAGDGDEDGGTPTLTIAPSTTTTTDDEEEEDDSTVTLPQCVHILGLERARNSTDLNGEWSYFGEITWTMSGQRSKYPVYHNTYAVDGSQRLLCFTPVQQRWFIAPYDSSASASACEYERRYAQCNQFGLDLLACQDLWRVYSTAIATDDSSDAFVDDFTVSVFDCASVDENGAFSFADADSASGDCVTANNLTASICMTAQIWNGSRTFEQYPNIACANKQPIFYHTIFGGDDEDAVVGRIYLHYFQFPSNAKWILSYDSISVNGVAECEHESLLECQTERGWTVIVHDGDSIKFKTDDSLAVSLGSCLDEDATTSDGGWHTMDNWTWIAIRCDDCGSLFACCHRSFVL